MFNNSEINNFMDNKEEKEEKNLNIIFNKKEDNIKSNELIKKEENDINKIFETNNIKIADGNANKMERI